MVLGSMIGNLLVVLGLKALGGRSLRGESGRKDQGRKMAADPSIRRGAAEG